MLDFSVNALDLFRPTKVPTPAATFIGGAAGYSVRGVGHKAERGPRCFTHVQLWDDTGTKVADVALSDNIGFATLLTTVYDLTDLCESDLDFLADLIETVYQQRAMS